MARPGGLEVLTVSELNKQARQLLESSFALAWVEGEISNFKHHSSGHMYFSLKDQAASISVAMFASANAALTFRPGDGQQVVARGRVTLYEARGQYQLVAQNLYPAGDGALWLKFEQLRDKLSREGLFETAAKKPLPRFPARIGLVTSPTGAAVRDILNVLARRAPHVTALLRPTIVQGSAAAADIAIALAELEAHGQVDVIIVARGGGSLEDLWAFNEEQVVRAVAGCGLPVISAVGHETDVTLCDLAADQRAPTPSAAAELAAPEREGYLQYIDEQTAAMERQLRRKLAHMAGRLEELESRYVLREPLRPIRLWQQTVTEKDRLMGINFGHQLGAMQGRLSMLAQRLGAADPQHLMRRGYVIVTDDSTGKQVLRRKGLSRGQRLRLHFADGEAAATVNAKLNETGNLF
ncbi:MAG: exodeoxyribonuclease VII large subunit [Candidatus Marinimicrobia bacterium]|nr:exodeoxyribonuclease VII large subunit [Candidatus Neomarinimicrobiota bacterium]